MQTLRINGHNIYIPDNIEPKLLAEIAEREKNEQDILNEVTNLIANTNGRIDREQINIGDLKTRVTALETGEGENWQVPLQQEATRRIQGDTNLKNQLDQEIYERTQYSNQFTLFKNTNETWLNNMRRLHANDRTFRPRISNASEISMYPANKGTSGKIGDFRGLYVTKYGNTVHVQGAMSFNFAVEAGTRTPLCDLPMDCAPFNDVGVVCQGSYNNTWFARISKTPNNSTDIMIEFERYHGGANNVEAGANAWLHMDFTYQVRPLDNSYNVDPDFQYELSPLYSDTPTYSDGAPTSMFVTDTLNNILT